jgi:hypothetical protein
VSVYAVYMEGLSLLLVEERRINLLYTPIDEKRLECGTLIHTKTLQQWNNKIEFWLLSVCSFDDPLSGERESEVVVKTVRLWHTWCSNQECRSMPSRYSELMRSRIAEDVVHTNMVLGGRLLRLGMNLNNQVLTMQRPNPGHTIAPLLASI